MNKKKESSFCDEAFTAAWEQAAAGRYPTFPGVDFSRYASLATTLHETGAGRLPALRFSDRAEFEDLIRAVFYHGEKRPLPPSMGAMMVKGWRDCLGTPHRAILLSEGGYSNVTAEDMGLSPAEWREKSYLIRLHHESTHYYTLRAWGFMQTALWDEFLADAMGLLAAFGHYPAARFLRFLGLENAPDYRAGGRLENYLPKGFKEERPDWRTSEEFRTMCREAVALSSWLEGYLKANPALLPPSAATELLDFLCATGKEKILQSVS